jgi:ferredoxin-nitrate reductase
MARIVKTTCSYCGTGCQFDIDLDKKKIILNNDNIINKKHLCIKGFTLPETINKGRLLNVLYRKNKNDKYNVISYKKAIKIIAKKIKKTTPDRIAFYSAGQILTEDYYIANKLFKGFIGTANIDSNSRTCIASALVALRMSLGDDYIPTRMEELLKTDLIIIAGANPANAHPIFFDNYIKKAKKLGKEIIVIDPLYTKTAEIANLYIKINPGTDVIFNNCVIAYLLQNNKLKEELDSIKKRVNNFDKFYGFYWEYNYEEELLKTGVSIDTFIFFIENYLLRAENIISISAMGYNQSINGVYNNVSLLNIHILLNKIAKPGNGFLPETGQANAMGGREVSGLATLLAAHFDFSNENNIKRVAEFWKADYKKVPKKRGKTILEILDAAENGNIDVLIIMHTDPIYSLPNRNRTEKILKNIPLVVEINAYEDTETSKFANLRIPAAPWGEKQGTQTNLDRKISLQKSFESNFTNRLFFSEKIKKDWEILKELAFELGYKKYFNYSSEEDIINEFIEMTKLNENFGNYSTLNIQNLNKDKYFIWKNEKFDKYFKCFTTNKKPNLVLTYPKYLKLTNDKYPLTLISYRIKEHWNSGSKTKLVKKIKKKIGTDGWVSMNERMVKKYLGNNIREGTSVNIESIVGKITLSLKIDNSVSDNCIAIPTFERKINYLTRSDLFDPFSKQPAYNITPVKISI